MGKWILIVVAILLAIGAVTFGWYYLSGLPPIVPPYPNAEQVATSTGYDSYYNVLPQITDFNTADSPATVLAFYDTHLTQRNWRGWYRNRSGEYAANNCPRGWYTLTVKATPQPSGLTHIVVTYTAVGCY